MLKNIIDWLSVNYIEAIASFLGILGSFFAIGEKFIFWVLLILNSILFFVVYRNAGLYALMSIQIYYVISSGIGLYYWIFKVDKKSNKLPIIILSRRQIPYLVLVFAVIYIVLVFVLTKYTDSELAFLDAFATAGSIVATLLMIKKYLQAWLIWIFLDVIIIGLFVSQKLYPSAAMFVFYFIFSIIGFFKWRKSLKNNLS